MARPVGDRVRHHRRLVPHHAGEPLRRDRSTGTAVGDIGSSRKRLRMLRLRRRHAVRCHYHVFDARADDVARADAFAHASATTAAPTTPGPHAAADVARALGAERNADLAGCLRRRRRLSGHDSPLVTSSGGEATLFAKLSHQPSSNATFVFAVSVAASSRETKANLGRQSSSGPPSWCSRARTGTYGSLFA